MIRASLQTRQDIPFDLSACESTTHDIQGYMPSMLDPPQFHAAESPGFMSLLLLMLALVDLRFKGAETSKEPDLCKIPALRPQRAITVRGNQAIVMGCKGCSIIAQMYF